MPDGHEFGVFMEDDEGPVFKEYCGELEEAKRRGQRVADIEGTPTVLFTIKGYTEIARFSPCSPLSAPSGSVR
jgi:hypothetical protein